MKVMVTWLLSPYKTPSINIERILNRIHTQERVVIERSIGQFKKIEVIIYY